MLLNIARGYLLANNKTKALNFIKLSLTRNPGPTEKEIQLDPLFKDIKLNS
jgi:hypothetical protein